MMVSGYPAQRASGLQGMREVRTDKPQYMATGMQVTSCQSAQLPVKPRVDDGGTRR